MSDEDKKTNETAEGDGSEAPEAKKLSAREEAGLPMPGDVVIPDHFSDQPVAVEGTVSEAVSKDATDFPDSDDADGFPDIPEDELNRIRDDIIAAIKTVYDPEIPVDIYELGLIYTVDIKNDYSVDVAMTLTSPGCPVAGEMPEWVVNAVVGVDGVRKSRVTLTFDPPWDMSMLSEEARFALNMF